MNDIKDKTDTEDTEDVKPAPSATKQITGKPRLYKQPRMTELDGSEVEVYAAELQKAGVCADGF